jgi:hypothetical protein
MHVTMSSVDHIDGSEQCQAGPSAVFRPNDITRGDLCDYDEKMSLGSTCRPCHNNLHTDI